MRPGRSASCDGIRFCYGAVPFFEKIASCTRALELPARWLFGPVQLLPQCCICSNALLVRTVTI